MTSQKFIILSLVLFFILSSIWLFFISAKYLDSDYDSAWWAIYFVDPKSQNMNFIIENHFSDTNFHWEISSNNIKINESDVMIAKGEIKMIPIFMDNMQNKKITLTVITNNDKKEIYKNL